MGWSHPSVLEWMLSTAAGFYRMGNPTNWIPECPLDMMEKEVD